MSSSGNFILRKEPICLQTHDKLLYARHPQRNILSTRARKHVNVDRQRELAVVIRHRCITLNTNSSAPQTEYHAPFVSSPSCPTTAVNSVSQFSASNRGLIRRSRSSTKRR